MFIKARCKRKRLWIHKLNQSRQTYGEFHHLFKELKEHPAKFHQYFRMSRQTFYYILKGIFPYLQKKQQTGGDL